MWSKSMSSCNDGRRELPDDGPRPAGEYLRVPVCCAECEKFWKAMILEVTKTHTSAAPACEMRTTPQGVVSGCILRIRSAKPLRVRNFPGLSHCMPNPAPGRSLSWTMVRGAGLGSSPTSTTRPNFEPRMSRGSSSFQNGTQKWKHVVPTYVGPSYAEPGVFNPSQVYRTKKFDMAEINASPSPSHLSGADRYGGSTPSHIKNSTTMSTNVNLHSKAETRKDAKSSGSPSSKNFRTRSDDRDQGRSKEAFNRTPRPRQQQHSSHHHDELAKSGFQNSPSSQYLDQKKATSSPKAVSSPDVKKEVQQDESTPSYVEKVFNIRPLITPEMAPTSHSSGFKTFDAGHGDQSGRNLSRKSTDESGFTSLSMGRANSRCADHTRNLSRTSTCASSVFEPMFLFTGHSCPSASEDSGEDDSVITNPNYFKPIITNISSYPKPPLTPRVPKPTLNPIPQP